MDERCKTNFSIYRKDYVPKPVKNLRYLGEEIKDKIQEYKDPLGESYKKSLALTPTTTKLWEEVDDYYERSKGIYPWMKEITEGQSADKAIVKRDQIFDGRSQYQVDYCDLETEIAEKEWALKNRLFLPEDMTIPETTQRTGYRNPIALNSRAYEKNESQPLAAKCSLNPNYKIRKILNVKTGDTEYMDPIGKLGTQIIVEQLHGIRTYYEG